MKTKVATRYGEVTLTGLAKNEDEKSLVAKLVTDIQGVTSVKNQMTVEEPMTKVDRRSVAGRCGTMPPGTMKEAAA